MKVASDLNENRLRDLLEDARRAYVDANPASRARFERACRSMPGGNTRSVLFYEPFPLTIVHGQGARVRDADGHEYLDFVGELSASLYGHSHPIIQKAIRDALADGIALGGPNIYESELAAEISRRFPSIELLRFVNSGTEANLLAITAARLHTGRRKVMVMEEAYHGGVLAFGGTGSPLNVPFDYVVAPFNDAGRCRALIERHSQELACVIVEPVQGSGGCIVAEREFLVALRESTQLHGIVLIFDEVMSSRLAFGGMQSALSVLPDLTTLGKYISGGLTAGAFGGRRDILTRFDPRSPQAVSHPGTFNNNVLSMAAGLAAMTTLLSVEEIARINALGDRLRRELNVLAADRNLAVQYTGFGSMSNLHFTARNVRSGTDLERHGGLLHDLQHHYLLAHGLYVQRRGYVPLMLAHEDRDIDAYVTGVRSFLDAYESVLPRRSGDSQAA